MKRLFLTMFSGRRRRVAALLVAAGLVAVGGIAVYAHDNDAEKSSVQTHDILNTTREKATESATEASPVGPVEATPTPEQKAPTSAPKSTPQPTKKPAASPSPVPDTRCTQVQAQLYAEHNANVAQQNALHQQNLALIEADYQNGQYYDVYEYEEDKRAENERFQAASIAAYNANQAKLQAAGCLFVY